MYYLIENTLRECTAEECHSGKSQYVAILSPEEWKNERDDFEMGIDMDLNADEIYATKAEVNYDSVTGTFALPDRRDMSAEYRKFAFALDEKGIVFIDPGNTVSEIIGSIIRMKKWRFPSLERFIYDFLEQIIRDDLRLLETYEAELDAVDQDIDNDAHADLQKVNSVRGNLRILRVHYDHLIDMAQEFEENENSFFNPDNLRYFRLFSNRVSRLFDTVNSLLDYSLQIRDTYSSKLDVKQNRIMTVLTVVTTIFMPLTLIVGWYGMNFKYMPELNSVFGYPAVIIVSIVIVIVSLLFFKFKKWL
ncbi:MAG: magnesium transporter CorA [Lachnospiraceae bacterium]|nr:magnesium transporter CorA [Lachnospiraceae bacterium]